jgi:hypothetical protein
MNTKEAILQNLDYLPEDSNREVLDFVLFLRDKIEQAEEQEDIIDAQNALVEEGFISLDKVKEELGL